MARIKSWARGKPINTIDTGNHRMTARKEVSYFAFAPSGKKRPSYAKFPVEVLDLVTRLVYECELTKVQIAERASELAGFEIIDSQVHNMIERYSLGRDPEKVSPEIRNMNGAVMIQAHEYARNPM